MIYTRGHTAVASKTSMPERQSLWGLGAWTRLQYSRQYNLQGLVSEQSTKSAVRPSTIYSRYINISF